MHVCKTVGKLAVVAGTVIMLAVPAMAGNGKGGAAGQGGGDRTQTRSQVKDGSCRDAVEKNYDQLWFAGKGSRTGDRDGTPDRTRSKDGSCLDNIQQNQSEMLLYVRNGKGTGDQDGTPDQDQDQDRDWLRDGSCLEG